MHLRIYIYFQKSTYQLRFEFPACDTHVSCKNTMPHSLGFYYPLPMARELRWEMPWRWAIQTLLRWDERWETNLLRISCWQLRVGFCLKTFEFILSTEHLQINMTFKCIYIYIYIIVSFLFVHVCIVICVSPHSFVPFLKSPADELQVVHASV